MSLYRIMTLIFGSAALLLLNGLAWGQNSTGSGVTISPQDRQFLLDAAQSGLNEVQIARWAIERSANEALKVYAQRILDDQALSNAQLQALAHRKGVALPDAAKPDSAMAKLPNLTGPAFDREFVREVIEDHQKDIAQFEKEDRPASDTDISEYAHSTLPKLHEHLDQAKTLKP